MGILLISIIIWYGIGAAGYIYWETSKNDIKVSDLTELLFVALSGPIAWIVGLSMYGKNDKILFKKRGSKDELER